MDPRHPRAFLQECPCNEANWQRNCKKVSENGITVLIRQNFPPDDDYPGEIVELAVLQEKLKSLHTLKLELKITDVDIREAILWADMLVGEKVGLLCNTLQVFSALQKEYVSYPKMEKRGSFVVVSGR